MPRIPFAELKPLLDQFSGEGTVLSCYAHLGVSEGFRPNWEAPFQTKADVLWKTLADDLRVRQEFEENLAAVRRSLEESNAGSPWIAVFSAVRRGFLQVVPLEAPVETDLVIDRSPYLVPLLTAIHRHRDYLAVHTDTHRGRVYAASPAGVQLLAEFDEDVPKHQHSAGERYGYGQATIARHREDRILHYRKELVREMVKEWDGGRFAGIILLGEHEVLEQVKAEMPQRMVEHVQRERPESWYETSSQVTRKIEAIAAEVFAEQEAAVAPGFWDLLREDKVLTGSRAVLAALQSGQLRPEGHGYLVFGPDPRETVGRCIACRTLATNAMGPCPRCQAPCAPGSLWEEVLLTALQHKISARFVSDARTLAPYGGIVIVPPKPKFAPHRTSA